MNTLRYIRMVLWSFFGIRRRAGAEAELARVKPVPLLLTMVLAAAVFVALLLVMARVAVEQLG